MINFIGCLWIVVIGSQSIKGFFYQVLIKGCLKSLLGCCY
jgi:hypothetical protein